MIMVATQGTVYNTVTELLHRQGSILKEGNPAADAAIDFRAGPGIYV